MRHPRLLRTCVLVPAAVLALTFLAASQPEPGTDLSGCWHGSWFSCMSRHKGPLHANFCKINETTYRVDFRGRFFKILPFRYSVTLNVIRDDGQTVEMAGSSNLGRMFGTFHYHATIVGGKFDANYTSCRDSGKFIMTRECNSCY